MELTKDRNSLFSGYSSEFPALLILFPRSKCKGHRMHVHLHLWLCHVYVVTMLLFVSGIHYSLLCKSEKLGVFVIPVKITFRNKL